MGLILGYTAATSALVLQNLADRAQDRVLAVATNESLAEAIGTQVENAGNLSDTQKVQVIMWVAAHVSDLSNQHRQYKLGLVPEELLIRRLRLVESYWRRYPYTKNYWLRQTENQEESSYDVEMMDWVQKNLKHVE
ncbi:MAG: hypothetical protein ACI9ON_004103 [Limisphaerales bacterium]